MIRLTTIVAATALCISACSSNEPDPSTQYGANPPLPQQQDKIVPTMGIAKPTQWGGTKPAVPAGYSIEAIATGLQIPRQTLVLPNGDILVSEGRGGHAAKLRPKDIIAGKLKATGNTSVKSGNRLTLLRDSDGDGTYEVKTVFADGLDAPYGMAFVNSKIYVANQGSLVRFDYADGQTKASGPPVTLTELPAAINHHWTKAVTASEDGKFLYVGIGSNSNVGERGLETEIDRAVIWQIDVATGAHRQYATGIRNPSAVAMQPGTGVLWAAVNERDELGPNLVPDYLTSVKEGGFYGWPFSYWGQNVDIRAKPANPDKVASAITPDYSLGSHVAPLGLTFSHASMGAKYAEGVFVGEHGSWNRQQPVGYKVVFIPFANGKPSGPPVDFVSGFRGKDGLTRGRPVGVTIDPQGALLVADDLSNTVWRITPAQKLLNQKKPVN